MATSNLYEVLGVPKNASPDEINRKLLGRHIVGGLPLNRFYPELDNCMLLCATEMSRREHMDAVAEVFA